MRSAVAGTPQGGVISPLLANIYLHVLDVVWTRDGAHLGTLVCYCEDFVVMCRNGRDCEEALQRVAHVMQRLTCCSGIKLRRPVSATSRWREAPAPTWWGRRPTTQSFGCDGL